MCVPFCSFQKLNGISGSIVNADSTYWDWKKHFHIEFLFTIKKNNNNKSRLRTFDYYYYYHFEFPYWLVWSAQRVCSICLMKFIRNSQSICWYISNVLCIHTPISLSDIKIKCFVFFCFAVCAKTNTRTKFNTCDYILWQKPLFFGYFRLSE